MSQRKLLAVVLLLTLGIAGSVAWYLAGERESARERAQTRPAPLPTSLAMPPGKIVGSRA